MKTIKTLSTVLLLAFSAIFLISCRSDNNDDNSGGNNYPKQVSVTYKVTSTTTSSASIVQYKNETGGNTDITNPSLPYSKTISRTVNQGDVLTLAYGTHTNQTVKLEILVNNVVVKSEENTTTASAIVYQFP